MANNTSIRPARIEDTQDMARLSGQLGYPVPEHEMAARLAALLALPYHAVFVASSENMLVGWVHVYVNCLLINDTYGDIGGIVVDEAQRSSGVGELLMKVAEEWARGQDCIGVSVRSGSQRIRAHAFYERIGYEHYITKSSELFRKRF